MLGHRIHWRNKKSRSITWVLLQNQDSVVVRYIFLSHVPYHAPSCGIYLHVPLALPCTSCEIYLPVPCDVPCTWLWDLSFWTTCHTMHLVLRSIILSHVPYHAPGCEIYLPVQCAIPCTRFNVVTLNLVHKSDILFLPHDKVEKCT